MQRQHVPSASLPPSVYGGVDWLWRAAARREQVEQRIRIAAHISVRGKDAQIHFGLPGV